MSLQAILRKMAKIFVVGASGKRKRSPGPYHYAGGSLDLCCIEFVWSLTASLPDPATCAASRASKRVFCDLRHGRYQFATHDSVYSMETTGSKAECGPADTAISIRSAQSAGLTVNWSLTHVLGSSSREVPLPEVHSMTDIDVSLARSIRSHRGHSNITL